MKLQSLLEKVKTWIEGREQYQVFILKDIELIQNDPEKVILYPLVDIEIEEENQEITFIFEDPDHEQSTKPFMFNSLYTSSMEMGGRCSDYILFSGSPIEYVDEYWFRLDVPLVSCGISDEDNTFVLIQGESNNDKSSK